MKKLILLMIAVVIFAGCTGLGLATVAGTIIYIQNKDKEIAKVELEASAYKVYDTAIQLANDNPHARVISKDKKSYSLSIQKGQKTVDIQISQLSHHITQITVSTNKDDTKTVVASIQKICEKMNKECSVEK